MTTIYARIWIGLICTSIALSASWGCSTSEEMTPTPDSVSLASYDLITEYQQSYPKYILVDGKMTGLCMDILWALEEASGLRIGAKEEGFTPFKRLQLHLEQGKVDIFAGMKKTDERSQYALFLEPPIYTVCSVIAVRTKDHSLVSKIEDVFGQTVMVPDGAATAQYIRESYPDITVDEGGDIFACLNKLTRGRHDFIIYHDVGLIGAIKKMGLQDQVTILPLILDQYAHYVAVRHTLAPDIIQRLEKALNELQMNNRMETIRTRYADSG